MRVALLWLISTTWLGACAPQRPAESPEHTFRSYVAALKQGDTAGAYDLLSEETRGTLSYREYRELVAASPKAVTELETGLSMAPELARVTATITDNNGRTFHLVLEGGEWQLEESGLDPYSQASPRAALGSFVRAFRNDRYDVLLSLAPSVDRQSLSADALQKAWEGAGRGEIEALISALEAALPSASITTEGVRAKMSYGSGSEATLIREDGVWKIEELQ